MVLSLDPFWGFGVDMDSHFYKVGSSWKDDVYHHTTIEVDLYNSQAHVLLFYHSNDTYLASSGPTDCKNLSGRALFGSIYLIHTDLGPSSFGDISHGQ